MAAAIPAPFKCCLSISLSDPVKLHEKFRIGSVLYQQGKIAACEWPHWRKNQYFIQEAKEINVTLINKGIWIERFQTRTIFK